MELTARGAHVVTVGRGPPPAGSEAHVHWDLAQPEPEGMDRWRSDVVIHAAAVTDVDLCETDPELAVAVNVTGASRVVELARRWDARLLYLSTDSVFDGLRGRYADTDQPTPVNVYGRTKLAGEGRALAVAGALVVRFNVVSPERLTYWILASAESGKPIRTFEDVRFNPVEVADLVPILVGLVESGLAGVYHAGSDLTVSKADYAELLVRHAGLANRAVITRVRLADYPMRAARPFDTSLQVSAAVLGLFPMPDLEAAIRRLARGFMSTIRTVQGGKG